MIGTRQWMACTQNCIKDRNGSMNTTGEFFQRLLSQGKKISQIVTYIWLNQEDSTAQTLDGYFKRGDDKDLKKLLCADDPKTEEYQFLLKVFKDEKHLPIFDRDDKQYFQFKVAVDKFEGDISDPSPSENQVLVITIPYPPRPEIVDDTKGSEKGFAPIKKSELKEWLDQAPDRQPYFYENNPYIPASSS